MCKVTLVRFEASDDPETQKNRHFFTFPRYLWALTPIHQMYMSI